MVRERSSSVSSISSRSHASTPRLEHKRQVRRERHQRVQSARQFAPTPGPGSYNLGSTLLGAASPARGPPAGTAAFKSKSDSSRSSGFLRGMGDPGAYDPHKNLSLGRSTARSFSKRHQRGDGQFGASSARAEWKGRRDDPGPAAYNTRPPWLRDVRRPSAGFQTRFNRGDFLLRNLHTPVVGAYDPEKSIARLATRTKGGEATFRSKDARFLSSEHFSPGPSRYMPDAHTIARAARERVRNARGLTSTRADLFRPPRVQVYV